MTLVSQRVAAPKQAAGKTTQFTLSLDKRGVAAQARDEECKIITQMQDISNVELELYGAGIWAIYLLKQLDLAEFRQVEANTKCDGDRLNCFISHVKLRLQESTWYCFQWLSTTSSLFTYLFSLWSHCRVQMEA